jgi:tRNA (guanine37-N1)-methyltransferase
VLIEALSRQVPGVVKLADSVENDSFRAGLLDHPHYTRPPVVEGLAVPEVLTGGDHAAIRRWRQREALRATLAKRPDLLAAPEALAGLTPEERRVFDQVRDEVQRGEK